jgi:hypothetical protein
VSVTPRHAVTGRTGIGAALRSVVARGGTEEAERVVEATTRTYRRTPNGHTTGVRVASLHPEQMQRGSRQGEDIARANTGSVVSGRSGTLDHSDT